MYKSKRELIIDQIVDDCKSTEEFNKEEEIKILHLKEKFSEELEDYYYIKTLKEFEKLSKGGYIRYIDLNDNLKWGGILLKNINLMK